MVVSFESLPLPPTGTTDGSVPAREVADAAKEADKEREGVFEETEEETEEVAIIFAGIAVDAVVVELKHEVSETATVKGSDDNISTPTPRPVKM